MTAPHRPTWGDFLRWVATERIAYCPGPVDGLKEAATYVESKREAFAAMLGLGMRAEFVSKLSNEWKLPSTRRSWRARMDLDK